MATVVTYNGVELHSVLTKRWDQEVVADSSGTDRMFSRYSLEFEGLVHAQGTTGTGSPSDAPVWIDRTGSYRAAPGDSAAIMAGIRTALQEFRKRLVMKVGERTVLECDGADQLGSKYQDLDNGPKPKRISVVQLTSSPQIGPVFKVVFAIDFCLADCSYSGASIILNNRWAISESLDDKFFTRKTIHGRIRISPPSSPTPVSSPLSGYQLEYTRPAFVPPLEQGFRRERIDFNPSLNGLECDYTVIDQQIHTSAPWPAAKMEVTHSEATATGADFVSELHISLWGHPGTSKVSLLAIAARIINNRIGPVAGTNKLAYANNTLQSFMMIDHIGDENFIEVYVKCRHTITVGSIAQEQMDSCADFFQMQSSNAPPGGFASTDPNMNSGDNAIVNMLAGQLGRFTQPLDVNMDGGLRYDPSVSTAPSLWGYYSQGLQGTGPNTPIQSGIGRLPIANVIIACYLQSPCDPAHEIGQYTPTYQDDKAADPKNGETAIYNNPMVPKYETKGTESTSLQSDEQQKFMYTSATCETIWHKVPCGVQLPIANDPSTWDGKSDTSVFATLGLPQGRMERHVDAERIGAQPVIPEPLDKWTWKDSNGKASITGRLCSYTLIVHPPITTPGFSQTAYRVTASYIYALSRPVERDDKLRLGTLPFVALLQKDTAVKHADLWDKKQSFDQGIADSTGVSTSSGGDSTTTGP